MKIVFMGTPDFAKESLEAIYNSKNEILAVITNPDKPQGRGMKNAYSPVKEFALEKNLKIYQPLKVRNNAEFIEEIKSLKPDVLCVVAYGKILPKEILDIPKYGAINVHGSLLPKYRGAAPIQWAVLNGDEFTGITTMFMDEGMDTGDMILQEKVEIGPNETTGELWTRLSKIGAELLVKTLDKIQSAKNEFDASESMLLEKIKEKVEAKKQPLEFTLAPMLSKEMALIDWNKSAQEIKNLVRGLNPIMGAYTFINGKKVKLWKVDIISKKEFSEKFENVNVNILRKETEDIKIERNTNKKINEIGKENNNIDKESNLKNGDIILADKKQGLFIKAGDEIISALEVQGENAKRMDIKSFLNGNNIKANI